MATISIFQFRTATPKKGCCFGYGSLEESDSDNQRLPSSKVKRWIHSEPDGGYQASHQPKRFRVIGRGHPPGGLVTPSTGGTIPRGAHSICPNVQDQVPVYVINRQLPSGGLRNLLERAGGPIPVSNLSSRWQQYQLFQSGTAILKQGCCLR